jgi:hyaluronan synthase
VPAYNEEPALLRACIDSLLAGSEIPELVVVVDDGSAPPAAIYANPRVRWLRQANQGKRIAQVNGLRGCEWASFVLTVDSDRPPCCTP